MTQNEKDPRGRHPGGSSNDHASRLDRTSNSLTPQPVQRPFHGLADRLDALASRRPSRSLSQQHLREAAARVRDALAHAAREDLAPFADVSAGLNQIAAAHGRRNAAAWAYRLADAHATGAPHG